MEKYGTLAAINAAWGTAYGSMNEIPVPRPNTVRGQMWADVLTWYIESKREFIEKQIQIFRAAVDKYSDGRIQLIIFMPGASYTDSQWNSCVGSGEAIYQLRIGTDNNFMVTMADKYGGVLQFTGVPEPISLEQVRRFMYSNGYGHMPVICENYADERSSNLNNIMSHIRDYKLYGIDYTYSYFLYNSDHYTLNAKGQQIGGYLTQIKNLMDTVDLNVSPF